MERVGRGPLGDVFQGYWHGQVAIKKFCLDETGSKRQLHKLREEVNYNNDNNELCCHDDDCYQLKVSILKKTRHHNLALFMGASLTPPNLAIITRYVFPSFPPSYHHHHLPLYLTPNTVSVVVILFISISIYGLIHSH